MQVQEMKAANFRKDVQGLRAIAVISVVLFHANKSIVPGGYTGVDIFFVISGFLISGIIIDELEKGTFSVGEFYRKRIRRIFPALYPMIAFSLLAGYVLLSPIDFKELAQTTLGAIFFSSNLVFFHLSGYFDSSAELKPLLHTWSLGVEEQFYLLYPLMLIALWKVKRNLYLPVLLILGSASLAISIWMLPRHAVASFFLTPPRAFELLLGAVCAGKNLKVLSSQFGRDSISLIGALLILFGFFGFDALTPFPGARALVPCIGAALIIYSGIGGGAIFGRYISSAPFLFFGSISYSLYLWHWPLLVFSRHLKGGELSSLETCVAITIAIFVATLSTRYIERPFLSRRLASLPYLRVGVVTMMLGCVAPVAVFGAQGLPNRFSTQAQRIFAASADFNIKRAECHSDGETSIPYDKNCVFGLPGVSPSIAIWGDSHGAELALALGELVQPKRQAVMEITASACPPSLEYKIPSRPLCEAHNAETFRRLISDNRIKTVVLVANFERYKDFEYSDMLRQFSRTVELLSAANKHVVVVYPIPVQQFDPPSILGVAAQNGRNLNSYGVDVHVYQSMNVDSFNMLNRISRERNIDFVFPQKYLCDSKVCHVYLSGLGVLYFNPDHLSISGAKILAAAVANYAEQ
jgi:peptidoglycan/LPS O-acetylase OafA/YrhL